MGKIKQFKAFLKPSLLMRSMVKHKGDVSEGSTPKIAAIRHILGKKITFYYNGMRKLDGINITDEDMFNSEILRFAHASLLTGEGVGDKRLCYVDATVDPVQVWLYSMPLQSFLRQSTSLVRTGGIDPEFLLGSPLDRVVETKNERNVRLFGTESVSTHFQN